MPAPTGDKEDFITVEQVAERLHIKPSTVYEWTRRRAHDAIPHYPISRKVMLFYRSEVARWVEAHKIGQKKAA
jgi:excisionase family DNA binding protein